LKLSPPPLKKYRISHIYALGPVVKTIAKSTKKDFPEGITLVAFEKSLEFKPFHAETFLPSCPLFFLSESIKHHLVICRICFLA